MRPPRDLHLMRPLSDLSCVVANVLHMYGTHTAPTVPWVDTWLNRQPGDEGNMTEAQLFLLGQGYSLHSIGTFDPRQFLEKGIAYLRTYYRELWNRAWEGYWNEGNRLERLRQECVKAPMLRRHVKTQDRTPTIEDIRDALERDRLVIISVDNHSGMTGRQKALVYDFEKPFFFIYTPSRPGGTCLDSYYESTLLREWLPAEGSCVVWKDK